MRLRATSMHYLVSRKRVDITTPTLQCAAKMTDSIRIEIDRNHVDKSTGCGVRSVFDIIVEKRAVNSVVFIQSNTRI